MGEKKQHAGTINVQPRAAWKVPGDGGSDGDRRFGLIGARVEPIDPGQGEKMGTVVFVSRDGEYGLVVCVENADGYLHEFSIHSVRVVR